MKLRMLFIAATLLVSVAGMAQSGAEQEEQRNPVYTVVVHNVHYNRVEKKKLDVGETLGKIANAVVNHSAVRISTETQEDNANGVVAAVLRGLTNTHRLRVTDARNSVSPCEEQYDFVIDVIVEKAATNYSTNTVEKTMKDKDGKEYKKKVTVNNYKANVDVTLQQKDARTKEILESPRFTVNDFKGSENRSQAMTDALNSISWQVANYYRRAYPLTANIVEGAKAKKDKQKELYIDLGDAEGAYSGLHMTVFQMRTVAGSEARLRLGKVKIMEVQGEHISLCKVQKGGKEIKEAIDAGKTLKVMTTD